jgi:ubiquinone/menaquinone biosynthesis C-methylase UbiE
LDKIEREKHFHNIAFSNDTRKVTHKYYLIAQSSRNYYIELIKQHGANKRVLEYGCGPGSCAFVLAQCNAVVSGIDISEFAIDYATKIESERNLGVTFEVMNAEELSFDDNSFDLICGSGILHHLQLDKAYSELARTLKPGGRAVFLEPLGHNILINIYRYRTPELRTDDEHPLLISDLRVAHNYFVNVETNYFHLCSLGAVLFKSTSFFLSLLKFLENTDRALFSLLPFITRYAWAVVIVFNKSK